MRHGKKFYHLGRKAGHRKAMLQNMACSLIEHKRIKTTVAKAKALRGFIEPVITKAKTDSTHSRRLAFRALQNKFAVTELFREVSPKVMNRAGGYTRIIRLGNRLGDNAEMCLIELVDFNEIYGQEAAAGTKKKRSRRGGAKKKADAASEEVATEETTEAKTEELAEAKEEKKKPAKKAAPKAKKVEKNAEDKPKADDAGGDDAKAEKE